MKNTIKNLYIENKCRFCGVGKTEKHENCYHGFADMMGIDNLDLIYK